MKKLLILMVLLLMGCGETPVVEEKTEIVKNVDVIELSQGTHQGYERYIGHISTGGILKRAFEVDGRVNNVLVEVGDYVESDTLLATIDTEGLNYALDAAKAELQAAQAQYAKARDSLAYTENLYNRTKELHTSGVASDYELDQIELNYNISQEEVRSARELINQAQVNVDSKTYLLDQSEVYAKKSGIVMDILVEKDELVQAGYPVVILRDSLPVVSFGVSQDDLKYLTIGDQLTFLSEKAYLGTVKTINQVPDSSTQTFEVELSIDQPLTLGSIVSIEIPTDKVKGTKIPLGAIRSDGEDFVFIVKEGKAQRVNVEVMDIHNQEVVVSGLPEKCVLVVEGIMSLNTGDTVKEVEE